MNDEERERLAAAFGSLRFSEVEDESNGDDEDDAWYVTGETTDGRPLQPFATFDNMKGASILDFEAFVRGVEKIKSESGRPLGGPMVAHPEVAERIERFTCGAVQAGAMVVICGCGAVRQYDRPHDYVADIQLRGWICYCGIFNGEEKERQEQCRTCQATRPI